MIEEVDVLNAIVKQLANNGFKLKKIKMGLKTALKCTNGLKTKRRLFKQHYKQKNIKQWETMV